MLRLHRAQSICGGLVFLLALAVIPPTLAGAAPSPPAATAEAIYAVFTVNLTRFISWPADALPQENLPLVIGTFPRDPINPDLDAAVQGEIVNGHPLRTMRLRSLDDIRRCQVVFVSRGAGNLGGVLARVGDRPILTVSDAPGFLDLGGHVLFVPHLPHISLQISATNLRNSGLDARAQLLRIATAP
jgi:hypothetical protein